MNPTITLLPHQKNAVARYYLAKIQLYLLMLSELGKTYEMIASIMEMKRLGIAS